MKHDSDILKRIKYYFMRRKSVKEAYEFEREMERDSFLYEAVEGLEEMLSSDIQQALDELDDRLDRKSQRALPFTWKQAASVAIVIGVGVGIYAIVQSIPEQSEQQEETVAAEETESQEYKPRAILPQFDLEDDTLIGTYAMSEADTLITNSTPQPELTEEAMPASRQSETEPKSETLEKAQPPAPIDNTIAGNVQSDKKDDLTGEAIAADEVLLEDNNDQSPTFSSEMSRTTQDVSEQSKEAQAMPSSERANSATKTAEASKSAPKAQPKNGMNAYKTYLKNNLQASNGMPSGRVVVTFELDRNGKPKKVEVAQSLCTACDAEAMRLVENGPEWESEDRKERVSVTVEFP